MSGTSENTFNPDGNVDNNMLASVLIRALGYDTPADYATSAEQLNKLTNISIPSGVIKRADLFNALVPALKDNLMKDGKSLGKDVLKIQAIIDENPAPAALEISEVSAHNLKQIHVKFNQNLNKDKLGSFVIKGFELSPVIQEDGMSVVLNAEPALKENLEYTLTVEKTEATAEGVEALAKTEMKFKVEDNARPTVKEIKFSGPKSVIIVFSEPIKTKGKVSVKQGASILAVNNAGIKVENAPLEIEVNLYSSFVDGKEYTFTIEGFEDFNKMRNEIKEEVIAYTKDTTAPTVEVVDKTQEYIVVQFSKPVSGLKSEHFHHTLTRYEANTNGVVALDEAETVIKSTDFVRLAKIKFYDLKTVSNKNQPLNAGSVKIMIDGDTIKDRWGNQLGNQEFQIEVVADTEKPEVKSVEVVSETQLKITFTEPVKVKEGKTLAECITVKDSDGKNVVTAAPVGNEAKNVYTVKIKDKLAGKSVTVAVMDMVDITVNENKIDKYEEVVAIPDKSAPYVNKVTYKYATDGKSGEFYVFFNEPVESSTATDIANYQLYKTADGTFHAFTGVASVFETNDVIKIDLNEDDVKMLKGKESGFKLYVKKVTDVSGVEILYAPFVGFVAHNDSLGEVKFADKNPVVATAKDTIVLTFNQKVTELNIPEGKKLEDIITIAGTGDVKVKEAIIDGSEKVTLKITGTLQDIAEGQLNSAVKLTIPANTLKGPFTGDTFKNNTPVVAVADKIKVNLTTKNTEADDLITQEAGGKVTIAFDRKIADITKEQLEHDLKVYIAGKSEPLSSVLGEIEYSDPDGNSNKVILTIKKAYVGTLQFKLAHNDFIKAKTSKNDVVAFDYTTTKTFDLKAPYVESVTKKDAKTVVLTFNEALYKNTTPEVLDVNCAAHFKAWKTDELGSAVSIKTATYKADDKTVTIEFNDAVTGNVLVYVEADIYDKDGNKLAKTTKTAISAVKASLKLQNTPSYVVNLDDMNEESKLVISLEDGESVTLGKEDISAIKTAAETDLEKLVKAFNDNEKFNKYFEAASDTNLVIKQKGIPVADGKKITVTISGGDDSDISTFIGNSGVSGTSIVTVVKVDPTQVLVEFNNAEWNK